MEAKSFFEQVKSEGVPKNTVNLTIKEYEEPAEAIVLSRLPFVGIPNLPFLFAIDRIRTGSTNKNYTCVADGILTILRDHLALPTERLSFHRWVAVCVHLMLSRHSQGKQSVAHDTAKSRVRFFKRALKCLADYSDQINGSMVYLPFLAQIDTVIADSQRLMKGQIRERATFKPLTLNEVEKSINSLQLIKSKLHLLKVLSMGFRPGEAARATSSKIIQGKLLLNQIITKTTKNKKVYDKIQSPEVPLSLRLIIEIEEQLNLSADKKVAKELSEINPPLRAMRTTSSCHSLYSGANIEVVRQRMGHTSLDMEVRHYMLFSINDVGSLTPEEYYKIPNSITVENTVINLEFMKCWDRWVLIRTLKLMRDELPECKNEVSKILINLTSDRPVVDIQSFEF